MLKKPYELQSRLILQLRLIMNIYKRFGKRLLDFLIAGFALIALTPFLIIVAFIIHIRLGSPVFFFQQRPGCSCQVFWMVKFRSMTDEKDSTGNLLPDSDRLTNFGKWLRATSIDELPELWNVLVGNMSLVGPRPLLMHYLEHYSEFEMRRHEVKPGITGLAQIMGRNAITWKQKFFYDVEYVECYGLLYDLVIILKTIGPVLLRSGISDKQSETALPFVPLGNEYQQIVGENISYSLVASTDGEKNSQWPAFDKDEIQAVVDVLESGRVNYWTGQQAIKFENEFAEKIGVKHAVAVSNGTVAIEIALRAIGIGAGDEVVVPARTFIGTASAVVQTGAKPIVADIEYGSQAITPETIDAVRTNRTKAVIVVHLGGWPAGMHAICEYAKKNNLYVIEDCAQSHGAKINGQYVGSFGDLAAFSFCQDKIMTTGGEGGIVLTNNRSAWENAWRYKDHGKNISTIERKSSGGVFRYVHDSFGTNLRMTEMQAAIGRRQLEKLDGWVETRRENANFIMDNLKNISGLCFPLSQRNLYNSFYRLYGFIDEKKLGPNWSRDRIVKTLVSRGLGVGVGSSGEIYKEKAFNGINFKKRCLNAELLNRTSLAFLVHPTMKDYELTKLCNQTRSIFKNALQPTQCDKGQVA
jgi:dTDP-4-amino-4,6-dideoxygalactose transaminase/lipopolysaccharide/colanic/teichoic acid biosynthesis glycosyltransferase